MHDRQPSPAPLFTQVDISAAQQPQTAASSAVEAEQMRLLRGILASQDRQNELLEELVTHLSAAQRQRSQELGHWKAANPALAQSCRQAAETLGRVQTELLSSVAEELTTQADTLLDGDFMLGEFVDRFGPRMAHLNGLLQVLTQLSGS